MATGFVHEDAASDSDTIDEKDAERIAGKDGPAKNKKKIPAKKPGCKVRTSASQILKSEIKALAAEKKRLHDQRKAISAKMKKSNRRRRRLLKKLKCTPTEDLVLMIRERERDETMERAAQMAGDEKMPDN
jgi:septal ring factor EnvC (AmiA/AmiB activator)